jgi:hypothetical protein
MVLAVFLLIINALVWLFISLVYFFNYGNWAGMINFTLGSLFLLDGFFYLLAAWGILKRIKILYFFGLILVSGNLLLTILDELGLIDFAVLALNLAILASLVLLRKKKFLAS